MVLGFRVLGFRGLGFKGLGFRVKGLGSRRVLGFQVWVCGAWGLRCNGFPV